MCVVEEPNDLLALERTGEFRGRYHVLMGALSPLDGIGPEDLRVRELLVRLEREPVEEVILATNPSVEGEATAIYLGKLLKPGACASRGSPGGCRSAATSSTPTRSRCRGRFRAAARCDAGGRRSRARGGGPSREDLGRAPPPLTMVGAQARAGKLPGPPSGIRALAPALHGREALGPGSISRSSQRDGARGHPAA